MTDVVKHIFLFVALVSWPFVATAEEIRIVALGASQTAGHGVAESDAYPAQLERILKAEGYSVSVANEGISGDTTRETLSRLNRAVPGGTKIVIVQPGANDNIRTKTRNSLTRDETKNNVEQMLAILKEKNIATVLLGYPSQGGSGALEGREIAQKYSAIWYGQGGKDVPADMFQADKIHLTKDGNAILAKNMSVIIKKILSQSPK